jgi:uncharacterized protein (DUF58 family)
VTAPQANELRFLDPAIIAKIGSLEVKARMIVEYRQYMPGEDLSTIDWKVYARSDRFYVKKFEEETNLDCHLLLDASASMGYGSAGVSKLEYGSYLAASLAYLMNRQRDAVGFMAFDDRVISVLPPSARPGHLRALLVTLERLQVGQRTNVSKPLHQLADALVKRGLVILISDLLDEPGQVVEGLKHFRFRGTDVIVFHVMDPHELTFPFERATRFRDLETAEEVMVEPALVREQYLAQIDDLIAFYRRELRLSGIDYCLLDTSKPLDFALMAYLATRSRSY